jgi:ribosomal protein S18 acetylase RimI-like enzyme
VDARTRPATRDGAAADDLALRPVRPEDEPFLCAVYAGTRTEELARVPWSAEEKAAFLRMQFTAQQRYYRAQFRDAAFDVVLHAGEPIGRLYVDRRTDELRVLDLALVPAARGAGIGTRLLCALIDEAARAALPLRIHVEHSNRAVRLYERLGFTRTGEHGVYVSMEWRAAR